MGETKRGNVLLLLLISSCCVVVSSKKKQKAAAFDESATSNDSGGNILGFDLNTLLVESADDLIYIFLSLIGFVFVYAYLSASFLSYDLRGKHVFITGGSSGIGMAVAKEYIKRGANVTIAARNKKKLADAVKILEVYNFSVTKEHHKIISVSVDVSSSEFVVDQAVQSAVKAMGREVDVLVNCAGTSIAGAFDDISTDSFQNLFSANVLGSVYPTKCVMKGMKERKDGRIVFVASQVAQCAIHGYSAYAASKWALRGLAESLQMELKPYKVLVSVVYPPDTDTPGYEEEMKSKPYLTKKLSESGSVFRAEDVAKDIVNYSNKGYFGISTGLDGWLLKQLHPGMSPVNVLWEVLQQIVFAPLARAISIFYLKIWDAECSAYSNYQCAKKEN